ncbi:MAG: hypothetical protein HFJ54_02630, partial [Clostridia bacterium]|nr:hypothetical protein [Clostridia bacterium]
VGRRALTKEEIEQIVSSKALTRDEIEEIVGRRALTKEEVEAIVRKQMLTREQIESIVGSKSITKEEIENVVKKEKLGKEEIQNIIKNEMLNIDYTRQLKQIEEMIAGLKDNYLELSNKLNIQEEHEVECSDVEKPDNIIDIKELKKAKKRKAYSIKEDILFSDLEETAYCVIPFGSNSEEANKRKAAKG